MSNSLSPLDQLHDVIAPSAVPWWPLSPLAFSLIAVLLGLIFIILYRAKKRHQQNKAKKEAIKQSKQMLTVNLKNTQAMHLLLKRLIKHYYSVQLANQVGHAWCQNIKATSNISISQDELSCLYQKEQSESLADLHAKLFRAIAQFKVKGALDV